MNKLGRLGLALLIVMMVFSACDNGAGTDSTPTPTVTPTPLTDAEAVAAAKAALAIRYQEGDNASSVTGNVTLPSTGSNSVAVSWATSNGYYITTAGAVTRPNYGDSDVQVTLTATLTRGEASDTKEFSITVAAKTVPVFNVTQDQRTFDSITDPTVYMAARGSGIIIAGTMSDGILYSKDGGSDWNIANTTNSALAFDQVYDVAYSGTGNIAYLATFSGLSTWNTQEDPSEIETALSGTKINDILVYDGTLYLATNAGVYYGDATDSPAPVLANSTYSNVNALYVDAGHLYASRNSDGTKGAELIVYDLSDINTVPVEIDVVSGTASSVGPLYANGSVILIAINASFYRSANGGTSFSAVSSGGGGTITGISRTDTALLAVRDGSDLWFSPDDGSSWSAIQVPGYDTIIGIQANGIHYQDSEVIISHHSGLITGTLQ